MREFKIVESNLEKYKKDLARLIDAGEKLLFGMYVECESKEFEEHLKKGLKTKGKIDDFKKKLPSFRHGYQNWYSEALSIVKLILPDRMEDFISYYEKPKGRKEIAFGNYVITDYLQGLRVTFGYETKVEPNAAIPQFIQQFNILKSANQRFESSLFDIKQLMQADLFDSELETAKELLKINFLEQQVP